MISFWRELIRPLSQSILKLSELSVCTSTGLTDISDSPSTLKITSIGINRAFQISPITRFLTCSFPSGRSRIGSPKRECNFQRILLFSLNWVTTSIPRRSSAGRHRALRDWLRTRIGHFVPHSFASTPSAATQWSRGVPGNSKTKPNTSRVARLRPPPLERCARNQMPERRDRGPKHPAVFVGAIFAASILVVWLFPTIATRTAVCSDCGAILSFQIEKSPIESDRRINETLSEPRSPVSAGHVHDFSDSQEGGYATVPRWKLLGQARSNLGHNETVEKRVLNR